ncbi:hypothetical protein QZH41_012214 [Actinostola sp. cb2023]|nr:hypothetical protein QZH41_012214 [Actinostola sp. cb2023]
MESKKCKKTNFAMVAPLSEQRAKRAKLNAQIFYSASMMTSKTARIRSSSVLRQSISDSIERNISTKSTLHQACREGHIEVVARHFGDSSMSIDRLDASGYGPLHYAARYQRTQIVLMLIDNGAGKAADDVDKRESEVRDKIRAIVPCDIKAPNPLPIPDDLSTKYGPPFDVISTSLCLEAVVESEQEYKDHVAFLAKMLRPGGYLMMQGVIEETFYTVGKKFYVFPLTKEMILDDINVITSFEHRCLTPLHVAVRCNSLSVARLLYGADPCQVDYDCCTAIHYAAKEGRADILRELLKTASMAEVSFFDTANADRRDTNSSLQLSVEHDHVEAAKVCIEYGADPSAVQDNLDTPLHVACNNGNDDMVALLLFHGAVIDAEDKDGMTPILRASLAGKVDIVDILLNEGSDVLPPPGSTMPAPLLCAVKRGHNKAIVFLLKRGSPIALRDTQYRTCLHIAVYTAGIETVRVILKNGGGILLDSRDKDGKTPMHYAALKIMEKLLQAGSRVDLKDEDEKLPLHYAAENGHLNCVQVLVNKLPSSIDRHDSRLRTPLNYAAIGAHSLVMRYLLNKGADTDNRDDDHVTPLIHAAKCGCYVTVETLLDDGAKIDAIDKNKNTALVTAAVHGKATVVTILLDRGADVSIVSLSDHNCLTAATAFGHRTVCMAIVNHSRWEEACQFENNDGYPPIKALIERFPDVVKVTVLITLTHRILKR